MGKRQHQSDKMYITGTEWSQFFGGKKNRISNAEFRRLPFDCCALSMQPFEHPVCSPTGVCYDLLSIMPYLKKYGTDPTTGDKLEAKQLTRLHFHKNTEGKYHCPVTYKIFNGNTKISAIKTTGNVYSYEAIDTLNIKVKNWSDLLTAEEFVRKDIIHLQDPTDLDKFNLTRYHHLKHNMKVLNEEEEKEKTKASYTLNSSNTEATAAISQLYASEESWMKKHRNAGMLGSTFRGGMSAETKVGPKDKDHAANFTTGEVSSSFTSTHINVRTQNTIASVSEDTVRYAKITEKAYVKITTNVGSINVELRSDVVPKTCENFLKHCDSGYYKNTIFHRSIRNFMVQGGDPTGTGKGGESAFEGGKPFKDEFWVHGGLVHEGRGVLSMANSGPDTNKSQFFITFRSCKYLDKKHTVFGSVVGGMETLLALERTETDDKDVPLKELRIMSTQVFVDPFKDLEKKEKDAEANEIEAKKQAALKLELDKKDQAPKATGTGIGKYMKKPSTTASSSTASSTSLSNTVPNMSSSTASSSASSMSQPKKKKAKTSGGFGNFSSW